MRKFKLSSVLAMLLSALLLITSLPMAAFAVTPSVGLGAGTPNYTKHRGSGMTADANGVMVYDDLAAYKKASRKDVALSTDYEVATATSSTKTTNVAASYDECSVLYADYAIYYDDTIEGNTVKIRYGLSMMDSVQYVDKDGVITEGKSPIELSASYGNEEYPGKTYNAGYGMVDEDGDGKVDYTTRHYEEKAILFYIINHTSYERIGQEDDVSILQDYIDQGYVVVTLDFKSHANATNPYIEQALVTAQRLFKTYAKGSILNGLTVTIGDNDPTQLVTSAQYIYCLPEGCRIERDVWFWDSSIWGVNGTMEKYLAKWNSKIAGKAGVDVYNIGELASVEDMIAKVGQSIQDPGYSNESDGKPIEYKLSMNIIYPSQPKKGYEVPVYVQEGTGYTREDGIGTEYKRGTFHVFALNGYACVQYDHDYWPFLYRWGYQFANCGSDYTLGTNLPRNAQAAMRCVRYLADKLGYSSTYVGAAGISKATVGLSALSIKNNKNYPYGTISGYDATFEGDLRDEAGNVTHKIIQPFTYYEEDNKEISSDSCVTYISSGEGYERLFRSLAPYEKVPLLVSGGLRDNYHCYNYWDSSVRYFEECLNTPWLPLTQLDQGHAYPVGDDTQFGYNRGNAMLKYFDVFLKPDAERAPEVLWATPLNGAKDVPVSTKWSVGPFTPYGWEMDSYCYPQAIQIRFLDAVDPESVNGGVIVTVTETGAKVEGTWVASQNDALYTFECGELTPGTRYTINVTSGVKGKNGTALAETRSITFKTADGTCVIKPIADTYVSSKDPDVVFGEEEKLQIDNVFTTLVSYKTDQLLEAGSLTLNASGTTEAKMSFEVFALTDYTVDEATLTYNVLTASEEWGNKISLGKFSTVDGNLSIDLSALLEKELGDTVTLALVSTDSVNKTLRFVTKDFESPTIKTELKTEGGVVIVKTNGDVVRDTTSTNAAGSDFWWTASGPSKVAALTTTTPSSDSKQSIRFITSNGNNSIKFYNSVADDFFTNEDVGRRFRVTMDIKVSQEIEVAVGLSKSNEAAFTNKICHAQLVPANEWTRISCLLTVSEANVAAKACTVGIMVPYSNATTRETFIDNLVIEECASMLTLDSTESGSKYGLSLQADVPGAPLNQPITVTFDEAMDLSTFKKGMVVTNAMTGERIKGTWAAADATNKVFTFTTNGLMAGTTYTVATTDKVKTEAGVACADTIVKTVATEGSYSLRPLATSYVSVANASTHYGLNADPVLDTDKLGVVTFSTKSLASAQIAKLYLDIDSATNASVRIYALNYTPDASLCYNSVKDSLTDANLVGFYEVDANGSIGIDLADILDKTFGDTVTFVLKAGYSYYQDFEMPNISVKQDAAATSRPFSDCIWRATGASKTAMIVHEGTTPAVSPSASGSTRALGVRVGGAERIKFFNTFKNDYFVNGDVGRTYTVSLKLRTSQAITVQIGVAAGCTDSTVGADGYLFYSPVYSKEMTADTWTPINIDRVTITQEMVDKQSGVLGFYVPYSETSWTFFDNIVVEEVIVDPITVDKDTLILMTENTEIEDVTNEDNPVKDELYPSILNAPIEVSFNTAMDITTFEKGMVVTNVATGNRVDGTWSATDATNMNFAFTTRGFVAGATYTVATTAAVKTLGGTAVGGAVIKTVTMEGSYALRPVVSSYVSKSEPEQHFGLDTDLVLDTNKLGVVTFSAKTLADAEDAFLYMPWNAARKTFIYIYAIPNYLPDNSLCYNSVKAQLTEANLVLMDEWEAGNYALDLSALADKDLGECVTLVIKAGYVFSNDFESYTISSAGNKQLTLKTQDNTYKTVNYMSYGDLTLPDNSKITVLKVTTAGNDSYKKSNFLESEYTNFLWRHNGASQGGGILAVTRDNSQTQAFIQVVSGSGNGCKFYNAFRPAVALTSDDVGRTFNVSYDIMTAESITVYTHAIAHTVESVYDLHGTNFPNKYTTAATADTWTSVSHTITLSETDVSKNRSTLGIQTNYSAKQATYFDNLLVEEVVSEFTLPADSFILVTENEASVDVTDANPVVDEIYEEDVPDTPVVPEPPVESVETKITAAEVALGTSITVHYYATLNEAHAGAQMRFTVDGVKTLVDGVKSGKEYVYSYTGIAPQALGENIKAELIVDGEVVATKDEYSVLQNCKNLLGKTAAKLGISDEKYAAMKTLIADLLEYGAAAQLYVNHKTDALVNEGNEGATAFVALGDKWSKMPTVTTDATVDLISAGLHFNNTNKLYFRFEAADITEDNFKVTIDGNEYTLGDFELTDNGYILRTEDIAATELDHLFTIELIKNGETVQTLEYGVFAYVYNMQNNTSEAMATLAKTLYNYGVSADAYALAE